MTKKQYEQLEQKLKDVENQIAGLLGTINALSQRVKTLELAGTKFGPPKEYPHWPITMPPQPMYGPYIGDPLKPPFEVTCGVAQGKG